MMTTDEICKLAADSAEFTGTTIENALYRSMNVLYRLYGAGLISVDDAAKEKRKLLRQYQIDRAKEAASIALMRRANQIRLQLGAYLGQVDASRCPLARIFDGRDDFDNPERTVQK